MAKSKSKDLPQPSSSRSRTLGSTLVALKIVDGAAEAFPPLKAISGIALNIVKTIDDFQTDDQSWLEFADYVETTIANLLQHIPEANAEDMGLYQGALVFIETLQGINSKIRAVQKKSTIKKIGRYLKESTLLSELREKFRNALALFQNTLMMATALQVTRIASQAGDNNDIIGKVQSKMETAAASITLDLFPYASHSSWNATKTCLDGTRTATLQAIKDWIEGDIAATTNPITVHVLSDLAGSGKSAVAHSISQWCSERGYLASAFFFDASSSHRNDCSRLFTTVARNLCGFDEKLSDAISSAARNEPSIYATASPSEQFRKLVLSPLQLHAPPKPTVLILDGLDEGYDERLLFMIRHDTLQLPPNVRLFITTRPEPRILRQLNKDDPTHIQFNDLDLFGESNQADIQVYLEAQLANTASEHKLSGWPRRGQIKRLRYASEGLFIWVSTVCRLLGDSEDPRADLKRFLDTGRSTTLAGKMDELYDRVLGQCNSSDPVFMAGYKAYIGAMLVIMTPLSLSGLKALLPVRVDDQRVSPQVIFAPLQSILIPTPPSEPIQFSHLSFREYLLKQVGSDSTLALDIQGSKEQLAHRCLTVLNHTLSQYFQALGGGYLQSPAPPIPDSHHRILNLPSPNNLPPIPEAFGYASEYWLDHLLETPLLLSRAVYVALRQFLKSHFTQWLEVSVIYGRFRRLTPLRLWLENVAKELRSQENKLEDPELLLQYMAHEDVGSTLHRVTNALAEVARRREALEAIEDATSVRRAVVVREQTPHTLHDLACTLNRLTGRLITMVQADAGLLASEEALRLFRSLSPKDHPFLDVDLANSLHSTAVAYDVKGQTQQALIMVEEAIQMNEATMERFPALDFDLAVFKETLARIFSHMNRYPEAIERGYHVIDLRRALLARDVHCPHQRLGLARVLQTQAAFLNREARYEEALGSAQEALPILDTLVEIWPQQVEVQLIHSRSEIVGALTGLERWSECVPVLKQSLKLLRQLVEVDPELHTLELGKLLFRLAGALDGMDHRSEAFAVCMDSIVHLRKAVEAQPCMYAQKILLSALQRYARFQLSWDNVEHPLTLDVIEEAVDLAKVMAEKDLSRRFDYGDTLVRYFQCLLALDRHLEVRMLSLAYLDNYRILAHYGHLEDGELEAEYCSHVEVLLEVRGYHAALSLAEAATTGLVKLVAAGKEQFREQSEGARQLLTRCQERCGTHYDVVVASAEL